MCLRRACDVPTTCLQHVYCCCCCSEAASCQIYDELLAALPGSNATSRRGASNSAFPRPPTGPLPWLYYLTGSPYLSSTDIDLE
jgi:hypothetical protein